MSRNKVTFPCLCAHSGHIVVNTRFQFIICCRQRATLTVSPYFKSSQETTLSWSRQTQSIVSYPKRFDLAVDFDSWPESTRDYIYLGFSKYIHFSSSVHFRYRKLLCWVCRWLFDCPSVIESNHVVSIFLSFESLLSRANTR